MLNFSPFCPCPSPANLPYQLFVKGLVKCATESHLLSIFGNFGIVLDCQIAKHRSGRSAGFAVVTYASHEEAALALGATDNLPFMGRSLTVRWYNANTNMSLLEKLSEMFAASRAQDVPSLSALPESVSQSGRSASDTWLLPQLQNSELPESGNFRWNSADFFPDQLGHEASQPCPPGEWSWDFIKALKNCLPATSQAQGAIFSDGVNQSAGSSGDSSQRNIAGDSNLSLDGLDLGCSSSGQKSGFQEIARNTGYMEELMLGRGDADSACVGTGNDAEPLALIRGLVPHKKTQNPSASTQSTFRTASLPSGSLINASRAHANRRGSVDETALARERFASAAYGPPLVKSGQPPSMHGGSFTTKPSAPLPAGIELPLAQLMPFAKKQPVASRMAPLAQQPASSPPSAASSSLQALHSCGAPLAGEPPFNDLRALPGLSLAPSAHTGMSLTQELQQAQQLNAARQQYSAALAQFQLAQAQMVSAASALQQMSPFQLASITGQRNLPEAAALSSAELALMATSGLEPGSNIVESAMRMGRHGIQ